MYKNLKEFSEKTAKEINDCFEKKEFKDSLNKNLEDSNGTFEVKATKETPDRIGDIVSLDGLELKNYLKNMVILWNHDYSITPIGKATSVEIVGDELIIKGIFAGNDFAQQIRKDYDNGFQKAVSIGFLSKERDEKNFDRILKWELLELSFVSVGMHPDAVDNLKKSIGKESFEYMVKMGNIKISDSIDTENEFKDTEIVEQKGVVEDKVKDEINIKRKMMEPVSDIYHAMLNVWYDYDDKVNTPIEDFEKIVKEAVVLITKVVKGEKIEDEKMLQIKEDAKNFKSKDESLSEKAIEQIQNMISKGLSENLLEKKVLEKTCECIEECKCEKAIEQKEEKFEDMNEEEKAIFINDIKKTLQEKTTEAQNALRDLKKF